MQARITEGDSLKNIDVRVNPRTYFPRIARTGYQLEIGGLKRTTQLVIPKWRFREERRSGPPLAVTSAAAQVEQLRLFDVRRDYRCFKKELHADYNNPALIAGRRIAEGRAELRGWSDEIRRLTDRGLVAVLSSHQPGEVIHYLDVLPLAADRKVNVERVAEVLEELGILADDRPDSFDSWLVKRTQDLAPQIAEDVQTWLRSLHEGGPRNRPHSRASTWGKMASVHPVLMDWSSRYQHFREVTREDIVSALNDVQGIERKGRHHGLRSLFRFLRRKRMIFRDPTVGIKVGKLHQPPLVPLPRRTYGKAVAAATSPEQRVMLALTVVHAARRPALKALMLEDIDLANGRITIGGHTRPLDDMTCRLLTEYLFYRHRRWPNTANRHLLLTRVTAHETGPVSDYWCHTQFAGLDASLEQMRIDRQLEEALAGGGDALRLTAIFGFSEFTAIRYAEAAKALLAGSLETASHEELDH